MTCGVVQYIASVVIYLYIDSVEYINYFIQVLFFLCQFLDKNNARVCRWQIAKVICCHLISCYFAALRGSLTEFELYSCARQ